MCTKLLEIQNSNCYHLFYLLQQFSYTFFLTWKNLSRCILFSPSLDNPHTYSLEVIWMQQASHSFNCSKCYSWMQIRGGSQLYRHLQRLLEIWPFFIELSIKKDDVNQYTNVVESWNQLIQIRLSTILQHYPSSRFPSSASLSLSPLLLLLSTTTSSRRKVNMEENISVLRFWITLNNILFFDYMKVLLLESRSFCF